MEYKDSQVVVFCGPMRSGKTKELFLVMDRLNYQRIPFKIFTPNFDTRNGENIFSRYFQQTNKSISIDANNPETIFNHINLDTIDLPFAILIDESQFFDKSLVDVIKKCMFSGISCYVAGLDCDANFEPFGPTSDLLAIATKIKKLTSICQNCKNSANMTALLKNNHQFKNNNILIGDDIYGVFCTSCYKKFNSNTLDLDNLEIDVHISHNTDKNIF